MHCSELSAWEVSGISLREVSTLRNLDDEFEALRKERRRLQRIVSGSAGDVAGAGTYTSTTTLSTAGPNGSLGGLASPRRRSLSSGPSRKSAAAAAAAASRAVAPRSGYRQHRRDSEQHEDADHGGAPYQRSRGSDAGSAAADGSVDPIGPAAAGNRRGGGHPSTSEGDEIGIPTASAVIDVVGATRGGGSGGRHRSTQRPATGGRGLADASVISLGGARRERDRDPLHVSFLVVSEEDDDDGGGGGGGFAGDGSGNGSGSPMRILRRGTSTSTSLRHPRSTARTNSDVLPATPTPTPVARRFPRDLKDQAAARYERERQRMQLADPANASASARRAGGPFAATAGMSVANTADSDTENYRRTWHALPHTHTAHQNATATAATGPLPNVAADAVLPNPTGFIRSRRTTSPGYRVDDDRRGRPRSLPHSVAAAAPGPPTPGAGAAAPNPSPPATTTPPSSMPPPPAPQGTFATQTSLTPTPTPVAAGAAAAPREAIAPPPVKAAGRAGSLSRRGQRGGPADAIPVARELSGTVKTAPPPGKQQQRRDTTTTPPPGMEAPSDSKRQWRELTIQVPNGGVGSVASRPSVAGAGGAGRGGPLPLPPVSEHLTDDKVSRVVEGSEFWVHTKTSRSKEPYHVEIVPWDAVTWRPAAHAASDGIGRGRLAWADIAGVTPHGDVAESVRGSKAVCPWRLLTVVGRAKNTSITFEARSDEQFREVYLAMHALLHPDEPITREKVVSIQRFLRDSVRKKR